MAKRYVKKKKKKGLRPGRLLILVLLAAALVVALILLLRSGAKGDAASNEGWYEDNLGRIEDGAVLAEGLKTFEKKTGVRPFLTLISDIDPEELDILAEDQYEALFSEDDRLLVVYDEWGDGEYYLSAETGMGSALTESDVTALLACIEQAYADPALKTYAEAFGTGFARGGEAVSGSAKTSGGVRLLLVFAAILLILGAVLILLLRRRARDAARWEDGDA